MQSACSISPIEGKTLPSEEGQEKPSEKTTKKGHATKAVSATVASKSVGSATSKVRQLGKAVQASLGQAEVGAQTDEDAVETSEPAMAVVVSSAETQTDVSLPERVTCMWQNHIVDDVIVDPGTATVSSVEIAEMQVEVERRMDESQERMQIDPRHASEVPESPVTSISSIASRESEKPEMSDAGLNEEEEEVDRSIVTDTSKSMNHLEFEASADEHRSNDDSFFDFKELENTEENVQSTKYFVCTECDRCHFRTANSLSPCCQAKVEELESKPTNSDPVLEELQRISWKTGGLQSIEVRAMETQEETAPRSDIRECPRRVEGLRDGLQRIYGDIEMLKAEIPDPVCSEPESEIDSDDLEDEGLCGLADSSDDEGRGTVRDRVQAREANIRRREGRVRKMTERFERIARRKAERLKKASGESASGGQDVVHTFQPDHNEAGRVAETRKEPSGGQDVSDTFHPPAKKMRPGVEASIVEEASSEATRPAARIAVVEKDPITQATTVKIESEPAVDMDVVRECLAVDRKSRSPVAARKAGGRRLRLARGITVDSGAADPVMPRRLLRGRSKVRPSQASRLGVCYVAADDGRIPNEGEADFKFQTKDGQSISWVFQIAEVNKILAAVSALVDSGHRVVFDRDEKTKLDASFIIHKETGKSIRMRRDRNVWVIDAYVMEDEDDDSDEPSNPDQGFARQE